MRVAVTGAAGYIGGHLLAELRRRGHEVHAQDLVLPNAVEPTWETFQTFNLMLGDLRAAWLRNVRPDAVIHLAALYGRVWGETDMYRTAGMNSGLTGALARDTASAGARLMFMSSSEVYGSTADAGAVDERSALAPLNMYGLSKKWGEEACAVYAPDGLMVTRLNMPYGPAYWPPHRDEVPHISGKPGTVGYNVLHSMLWEAHHGLDLVVHRGTRRCLTWVGDSCRGLADVLESGQSGTWNVNRNDDHRCVQDIAHLVRGLTGSDSKVRVTDPPPRVTLRKSLRNLPLQELGWEPEVELEDGMKRTYDYFRKFGRDGKWRG